MKRRRTWLYVFVIAALARVGSAAQEQQRPYWNLNLNESQLTLSGDFKLASDGTVIATLIPAFPGSLTTSVNGTVWSYVQMDASDPLYLGILPASVFPYAYTLDGIADLGGTDGINMRLQNISVDIRGAAPVTSQGGGIYTFPNQVSIVIDGVMDFQGFGPVGGTFGSGSVPFAFSGNNSGAGPATIEGPSAPVSSGTYKMTIPVDIAVSTIVTQVAGLGDLVFEGRFAGQIVASTTLYASLGSRLNPVQPWEGFDPDAYGFDVVTSGDWVRLYGSSLGGNSVELFGGELCTSIEFDDYEFAFTSLDLFTNGQFLGSFLPGDVVDLSGLPGGGASSFIIRGIPYYSSVDMKLGFDSDGAVVNVYAAVPEVSSLWLGISAIGLLVACRRYRRVVTVSDGCQ